MAKLLSPASPRVCVCVASPEDARAIALFMRRLSAGSWRSHSITKANDDSLCVIARDRDSAVVVGQALAVPEQRGMAEVGLAVADAYQDQQICSLLLEWLMQEARGHGIWAFHAAVRAENEHMLESFQRQGYALVPEADLGVVHAIVPGSARGRRLTDLRTEFLRRYDDRR